MTAATFNRSFVVGSTLVGLTYDTYDCCSEITITKVEWILGPWLLKKHNSEKVNYGLFGEDTMVFRQVSQVIMFSLASEKMEWESK